MKQSLLEIEQNIASRKEKDRIMWFSMWAVLAVASFGVAWFPMIYYAIKRRNDHFARQEKLEELVLHKLGKTKSPTESSKRLPPRNAAAWTVSTLLIVPAFYVFYFLKNDLHKHEAHEHEFLAEVRGLAKDSGVTLNVQEFTTTPSFPPTKYAVVSVATLGLAAAYWLYRIFNDYNSHCKMQWIIEDELVRFLKSTGKEQS